MRPDRLSENSLIDKLKRLNRQFQELRVNRQLIGSKAVRVYRIFTQDTYDIEVTNVGFNNRIVEVTFTPAIDDIGMGGVFRYEFTATYSSNGNPVEVIREDYLPPVSGPTTVRLYLSASDQFPNDWVRIKSWVWSNGAGTISHALV